MPEKYTTPYPAKRIYSDGRSEDIKVLLAKECPVKLFLNGKLFTTLFASPFELKELAVGHLITEGIVSFREIENIEVEGSTVHVRTRKETQEIYAETSGEVGEIEEVGKAGKKEKASRELFVDSDSMFEPQVVFAGTEHLESDTYKLTRGTHLAALIDRNGKLAVQIVDVGRHNAVDKAVGAAFLKGLDLSQHYMLSTGRQPAYMVIKAARAGVPLIATKSMPFDSGVEAAKKANVCLIGQLRNESMLIFASEWRVKF
ncbi:formate dehydrogenase accessory sulfurtransferase FdhD [Methanosarcina sp.]|uniref:formate dehydrogenase accessory sulfurtransferase FdhD n=1 Tax=Methanosarcina sp. TaxID=2213 RepID=UPI002989598C|nr:formate dehydrogenase accessory sulfurtransferase FdhD [Methanosarcina sp.]MDW5550000.1 formate dehydrogenase accessory sulfurtransferase FdhD [Methanosarcina sp.]MDW5553954.1 formate dehydrogenase accessory sulfurtransferase FdhD [Methanosarcina sp.]MDW5558541.1 formate dehydrogenase accessory sulfurtransferase FdhD [Methanosarcina sp.]